MFEQSCPGLSHTSVDVDFFTENVSQFFKIFFFVNLLCNYSHFYARRNLGANVEMCLREKCNDNTPIKPGYKKKLIWHSLLFFCQKLKWIRFGTRAYNFEEAWLMLGHRVVCISTHLMVPELSSSKAVFPHPTLSRMQHESGTWDKLGTNPRSEEPKGHIEKKGHKNARGPRCEPKKWSKWP